MKRLVFFLVCAAVCVLCLSGCKSKLVGNWESTVYEFDGATVTEGSNPNIRDFMKLELEDDGKGTVSMNGTKYSLKWEEDGSSVTVKYADSKAEGTLSDDGKSMKLTIVSGEGMGIKVTLEKKE